MPNATQSIWLMVYAWLVVLVAGGLAAGVVYWFRVRQPLWQPRDHRVVQWDGWMVLLLFFLMLLLPSLVHSLLVSTGFFHSLYGPDFPIVSPNGDDIVAGVKEAANLRGLWANLLAVPLVIALILVGLRLLYRVDPSELGLTGDHFSANLVLGWLIWLILTPIVFAVYFFALVLLGDKPDQHGLTQLGSYAGTREWAIFGVSVTVLAPCIEEILFRGVLLFWLLKMPDVSPMKPAELPPARRADVCYGAGLLLSLKPLFDALERGVRGTELARPLAPMIFILALLPFYLLLPLSPWLRLRTRLPSAQEIRAILATSILFAAVHSSVWPSPIPLFVLGLGLGYVTVRTRSLVPAILIHSLFNSVSAVYLAIGGE